MIDLAFQRVSKKYRIRHESDEAPTGGPAARALRRFRPRSEDFWAVRDVSFEVERGEALGIIGHNGAGKSTVLKLLSSITAPTSGEIRILGRLSSLIEVGSGFHPELTGRENIYLNGSILGMRRQEITAKLDSIIEFSGVEQFIDTPVKRFSSGMYVRLGFSIAAHLEADILLLDEVLAVGDATFQARCIQRINDLRRGGTTVVFISHDLGAVGRLCDRVLLFERGQILAEGPPQAVIAEYQRTAASGGEATYHHSRDSQERVAAEIRAVAFRSEKDGDALVCQTGAPLFVSVEYSVNSPVPDAVIEVNFYGPDRQTLCQCTTEFSGDRLALDPGQGRVEFFCPAMGLLPGIYYTDVFLKERGSARAIDYQYRSKMLLVDPGTMVAGRFYMPHEWRVVDDATNFLTNDEAARDEVTPRL